MDFTTGPDLVALADSARSFALDVLDPREFANDSWLIHPSRDFSRALGERGWLGLTWPTDFGGGGRPAIERLVIFETLISMGAPLATSWFADRQIGPTLLQFGTEDQCRRWLPDIIAGTSAWCIGMSEPDAGSDVASIRTTAVPANPDGSGKDVVDHWIVNGTKVWTSGATDADWCYLIARTESDVARHRSLSEFVVDMRSDGICVSPIVDITGNAHFCEVTFTDVRVPNRNLIGTRGNSFKQVMRQMEHERGGIDRLVSNRRLYDQICSAMTIDGPLLRQRAARIESGYTIGRQMVVRETIGQAPAGYSALTKTFCTELEVEIADFAASVAGLDATRWDEVARALCYAPAYTIMGGTTQILRNIIAERILGLPR